MSLIFMTCPFFVTLHTSAKIKQYGMIFEGIPVKKLELTEKSGTYCLIEAVISIGSVL